jgi:glutamate/tyrosine decarboxylase-like PLP-dependent enzyme
LREELQKCVTNAIPVISVIAVMGSTEESAIDPLIEILAIREEFKRKVYMFV